MAASIASSPHGAGGSNTRVQIEVGQVFSMEINNLYRIFGWYYVWCSTPESIFNFHASQGENRLETKHRLESRFGCTKVANACGSSNLDHVAQMKTAVMRSTYDNRVRPGHMDESLNKIVPLHEFPILGEISGQVQFVRMEFPHALDLLSA